jgi:hypothetical protein
MLSGEATNTNFIVIGLTIVIQQGCKVKIYTYSAFEKWALKGTDIHS